MATKRCALAALREWSALPSNTLTARKPVQRPPTQPIRKTSEARLQGSLDDQPFDIETIPQVVQTSNVRTEGTVLYLAYGSNLCDETFLGKRGIRPVSQINVLVPAVVMTFDLPGIAFKEPCFANIRYRTAKDKPSSPTYHKDRWHKPLVGVVYEVTLKDYAHIIATEGGGSGYQDVLVDCYPLDTNPRLSVPETPENASFKAHTLFDSVGQHRANPSYAQPSARYLKLITDGAMERNLPYEYQDYLHQIRPYRVTTFRQQLGQMLFLLVWGPILLILMRFAAALFAKPDGTFPSWLARLLRLAFSASWGSYDAMYKPVFGDGERTIGEGEDDLNEKAPLIREAVVRYGIGGRIQVV